MPVYMDCNATTPMHPDVKDIVLKFMVEDFGNPGSRTHIYGARAKEAVERAREQISHLVGASRDEVIFTSGATESNNIAILGLLEHGKQTGRKHIVASSIEHKAVLEPVQHAASQGFDISLVNPTKQGLIDPNEIKKVLRPDTLLVSVMHVNNETGTVQPLIDIANCLRDNECFFHTDAAQGFGKEFSQLIDKRIDLISISGHKIFGPKGVGALITRRRGLKKLPLKPLMYGGGQERGLRPGTIPTPLIAGLGLAADLASKERQKRLETCQKFRANLLSALEIFHPEINGSLDQALPSVLNLSIPGLDSETVMIALKDLVAISNGSACTSQQYEPSHVLTAMKLPTERIQGALRWSWCHFTPEPDWNQLSRTILQLV